MTGVQTCALPICKLIGAVSYSLGSFSKEPIAGITPIAEMTAATALAATRPPGAKVQVEFPLTPERLEDAFRRAASWNHPSGTSLDRMPAAASIDRLEPRALGSLMRPIATPLVMGGFETGLREDLTNLFTANGFLPLAAGAGTAR